MSVVSLETDFVAFQELLSQQETSCAQLDAQLQLETQRVKVTSGLNMTAHHYIAYGTYIATLLCQ